MEKFWNSSNLLKTLVKWKKHISIITFLGIIIIGASTYLIKPLYKSYAIVYPVNLGGFSGESFSEQMMQVFESVDITDKVIKKYNLVEHYKLDTASKELRSSVYKIFNGNVSFSKTEYESVEINVLDTDPETAKQIVNSIIKFYNEKVRDIHRLKNKEVMDLAKSEMLKWEIIKDSLNTKIQFYKTEYNIQNVGVQLENLTQGIYRASGNAKLIEKAEKQINLLGKYGSEFMFFEGQYWKAYELFNANKLAYKEAEKEYNKKITYADIITSPYVADTKFSPNRALITLFGGMSLFVLVVLIIEFLESKKRNI